MTNGVVKIVNHTGARDNNGNAGNSIDKCFIVGSPIGKAIPKGGGFDWDDDRFA